MLNIKHFLLSDLCSAQPQTQAHECRRHLLRTCLGSRLGCRENRSTVQRKRGRLGFRRLSQAAWQASTRPDSAPLKPPLQFLNPALKVGYQGGWRDHFGFWTEATAILNEPYIPKPDVELIVFEDILHADPTYPEPLESRFYT